jgi:hypothetical protein
LKGNFHYRGNDIRSFSGGNNNSQGISLSLSLPPSPFPSKQHPENNPIYNRIACDGGGRGLFQHDKSNIQIWSETATPRARASQQSQTTNL